MRYINTLPYKEVFNPSHGYKFSDDNHSVFIPANELFAYNQGEVIQKAMPSVSANDREWLMTGLTPQQFEAVFRDNQDKNDE